MGKPQFDPNQPFEDVNVAQKPKFDPGGSFDVVDQAQAGVAEKSKQAAGSSLEEKAKGFLSGLAESMTFGYAPELYELTGAGTKEEYEQYVKGTTKAAPTSKTVGEFAGYIAPGSAIGKGASAAFKGAKALPKAAQALAAATTEGAAISGLQKADDMQQKLHNVAYGALAGGTLSGAGQAFGRVGTALKEHAKALRIKGTGAMLKDFRSIYERGEINKLNSFIKSHKVLTPGSSVETVVNKTKPLISKIGKKLDDVYSSVKNKIDDDKFLDSLTPKQQDKFFEVGFYPGSSKDEAISYIKSKIKIEEGSAQAIDRASKYLDQVLEEFGDDITIKQANDIKSAIDRTVKYSRNPMSPDPIKEQAFYHLRTFINNKIKDQVKFIDDVVGGEKASLLKKLNSDYGSASKVLDISSDRVARDASNRIFGLSEQIASGALGAGSLASGQNKETAALMAGLGFVLSKGARKYGPGIGAPLLEAAGGAIRGVGKGLQAAATPAAAMTAEKPKKGPGKWKNAGVDRLKEFTGNNKYEQLRDSSDKQVKNLLIQASALNPDSKAFKTIVKKLEKKVGEK